MKVQYSNKTKRANNQLGAQFDFKPVISKSPQVHPFLYLSRRIGNRALGRLIQAKLTINEPGDKYEQEADRVADEVMRMPGPAVQRKCEECASGKSLCSDCAGERESVQRKPLASEITPIIQRQETEDIEEEEEETLQTKETSGSAPKLASNTETAIDSLRGEGTPLPDSVRAYFEPRFGYDFSHVRVHSGSRAADISRQIKARAFTTGRDIAFGAGEYSPNSSEGNKLLAHELTHVVQQSSSRSAMIQREQLHFYDYTDNALRRGGYADHYCADYSYIRGTCVRDKPGMLHAGIDEISDIEPYVRMFRGRGHSIDALYFHTHGAPGYIHLPKGGIRSSNVWNLNSVSSEISAGATIGFLGCNVGEGSKGNRFLLNAGSSLLMNGGGRVYASDSVTFSVPGIGQRRPIWSSLKRVCVDPGGSSRIC